MSAAAPRVRRLAPATIFPVDPALAKKALRLQREGLKGKATSERLGKGITTDQANLLAAVGYAITREEENSLTANEVNLMLALANLERERRARGDVSSPKAKMLCRRTGLSEGQIARMTRKRLNPRNAAGEGRFGLLDHSRNGHIWLLPLGWALVSAIEGAVLRASAPPREPSSPAGEDAFSKVCQAGRYLIPYLEWTIGPESPGHHPTMPSAVRALQEALALVPGGRP